MSCVTNGHGLPKTKSITHADQVALFVFHTIPKARPRSTRGPAGVGGTSTLISNTNLRATSSEFNTQARTKMIAAVMPYDLTSSLIPTWGDGRCSATRPSWFGTAAFPAAGHFVVIQIYGIDHTGPPRPKAGFVLGSSKRRDPFPLKRPNRRFWIGPACLNRSAADPPPSNFRKAWGGFFESTRGVPYENTPPWHPTSP